MNKRMALLLSAFTLIGSLTTINANTFKEENIQIATNTTTSGTIYSGETTTPQALKSGFKDTTIRTDKGYIHITTNGSIQVIGDTTYNPETGSFGEIEYIDIPNQYTQKDMYGHGAKIKKDITFIVDNKAYAMSKGDIYTRRIRHDDDANNFNIFPKYSFAMVDGKWLLISENAIIYNRYNTEEEIMSIDEIVAYDNRTVRLDQDITLVSENNIIVVPKNSILISTMSNNANTIEVGEIRYNTIINYPNGTVELITESMKVLEDNVEVGIQNYSLDNKNVVFARFVINKTEEETSEPTPTPPPIVTPPETNTDTDTISNTNKNEEEKIKAIRNFIKKIEISNIFVLQDNMEKVLLKDKKYFKIPTFYKNKAIIIVMKKRD